MEYRLGNLAKVNRGASPRPIIEYLDTTGYPWLKISDFKLGDKYVYNTKEFINKEGLNKTRFVAKGTLILTNSATPGIPIFLGKDMCLHDGFLYFTEVNEKILNKEYLYYYFLLNRKYIVNNANGSVFKNLKKEIVENLILKLPQLNEQLKIVRILNNINKKIELNNRINSNLYNILKQIYKKLYLNNFNYDKWQRLTLNDVTSKFATGLNPRKNFVLGHGNNYYVTIKNMSNNQVILNDKCDKIDDEALIKINKRSDLQSGDLLFSGIGTIGRTYLIKKKPTNWNISESVFTIRPNKRVSSEFLYLLLLDDDMQNYALTKASGSVQKGIRMTDLKLYKLNVPSNEWMMDFTNKVSPLIDKIYLNFAENNSLKLLRDTLLPRLMNGEIDLDKIKI